MTRAPISLKGFTRLRERLRRLKEVERPAVLTEVQRARELGDLSENFDYQAARDEQRRVDGEIRRLDALESAAEVIDTSALSGGRVMFGASVAVADENGARKTYLILSEYESDASQNIISVASPLARSLIGKSVGDSVVVRTPSGEKEYEILEIRYEY